VAPAFARSADFALTKPAGRPCPHLRADSACSIHTELRPRGFGGCAVYDCFGAGQQISQVTFGGRDWRQAPGGGAAMFAAFGRMRALHELLWHLAEALMLPGTAPLHSRLRAAYAQLEADTQRPPAALAELDLPTRQRTTGELLAQASLLARTQPPGTVPGLPGELGESALPEPAPPEVAGPERGGPRSSVDGSRGPGSPGDGSLGPDLAGADLAGRDLRRRDLRRASLRGALLIGADLRGCNLAGADLAGADLRGARLAGADLSGSLFLAQAQLEAAAGDAGTMLPLRRARPSHWRAGR
jgi:hypothetical protein